MCVRGWSARRGIGVCPSWSEHHDVRVSRAAHHAGERGGTTTSRDKVRQDSGTACMVHSPCRSSLQPLALSLTIFPINATRPPFPFLLPPAKWQIKTTHTRTTLSFRPGFDERIPPSHTHTLFCWQNKEKLHKLRHSVFGPNDLEIAPVRDAAPRCGTAR